MKTLFLVTRLICLLLSFVVKAVLGSGSSAWASSNGFYIDISPPEFDTQVMFYVDVSQGEDLPAELQAQGSNDTIKAVWLCEDKQSEIAVGCLHFENDLLDRYVLCRCKVRGRIFLQSYKLKDLMTLLKLSGYVKINRVKLR